MSGQTIAWIVGLLVAGAIAVVLVFYILSFLYRRSSKETSFVRTGFGGERVVVNGGAFVLPIIHQIIPVNMNTMRLELQRGRDTALITKDRMRVDVAAEFYLRVASAPAAIAAAAQALGMRTMQPDGLRELVEGRFVDALRTVAAETTMEEMHERRGDYVKRVKALAAEGLPGIGLALEAVSLTQLDQTNMEFFNPANAFDAEGLTRLTEQIERRKKVRNDIEQDTMIQIRNKNLEAEKLSFEIDRASEYARLENEQQIETQRAAQRAELARERAQRERDSEQAQIEARREVETTRIAIERRLDEERIARERDTQRLEIDRRQVLDLAEQERSIAVAEKSKAQSEAQAEADIARAHAVAAEEKVFSAREIEQAERRKQIELILAAQEAEREGVRMRVTAEAEKDAAADRAEAARAEANGAADADKIRALAARIRYEIDAEGQRLMNEAQNVLTPEARASAARLRIIDRIEGIVRESVKPLEKIEGIRIFQVNGLGGGGSEGSGAGVTDDVVNSALRYRAQAPIIDHLMRELGLDGSGDISRIADNLIQPRRADVARQAERRLKAVEQPGGNEAT